MMEAREVIYQKKYLQSLLNKNLIMHFENIFHKFWPLKFHKIY